jgi:hypothetical protein
MKGRDSEFEAGFHHAINAEANVICIRETLTPNAGGFAKVDIQMDVQLTGKAPDHISSCWLVKIDSLDQVSPDKIGIVKVNQKNHCGSFQMSLGQNPGSFENNYANC